MVRNIMGTLFEIGRGEKPVTWLKHCYLAKIGHFAAATTRRWVILYQCAVSIPISITVTWYGYPLFG